MSKSAPPLAHMLERAAELGSQKRYALAARILYARKLILRLQEGR